MTKLSFADLTIAQAENFLKSQTKKSSPMPPVPKQRKIRLPKEDEDHDVDKADLASDEPAGTAWFIIYEGSNGDDSERRITIRNVVQTGEILYINAFCHERSALRKFRLDRIIEATDLATGEVLTEYPDLLSNFTKLLPKDADGITHAVLREAKHALNILAFLSRCDGQYHPAEEDVIFKYIADEFFDREIDESLVIKHVRKLYPDHDTYLTSIRAIYPFKGEKYLKKVVRYGAQLIAADEVIMDEEFQHQQELESRKTEYSPSNKDKGKKE